MKYLISILLALAVFLSIALVYADVWGSNRCKEVKGNWIQLNGGMHCVDNNFKEIDIYSEDKA